MEANPDRCATRHTEYNHWRIRTDEATRISMGGYKMSVSVGDQAPDFTLLGTGETEVTLSSFRGRQNVVMVFYTGDSTPG